MSPEDFIKRWRGSTRTEKSAAQEHFLGLCELLEVPKPADVDRHGTEYTFEKSVLKLGGTAGYADVWKSGCFAWEYKGPKKNLVRAYAQLKQYADALGNPPLLIVSDLDEIRIHTNFTNSIARQYTFGLADLISVETRNVLRACFLAPEKLRPETTRETVTAEAATQFARLALALRNRRYDPRRVAHFLNKLVFCLFVEDIDLLPNRVFADILDEADKRPDDFAPMLKDLFRAMRSRNGRFGASAIPWFNGGLFDDDDVLPLGALQVRDLIAAARLDWSAIDPTIFGTLFESGLDEKKRRQMASLFDASAPPLAQQHLFDVAAPDRGVGIHYTDPATIRKIIEPVVIRPLRAEWEEAKALIAVLREKRAKAKAAGVRTKLANDVRDAWMGFRARLGAYRVLDAACGSGNFLALALTALKDFDQEVRREGRDLDLPPDDQRVGPDAVLGIEVTPYAAELARLTIWITELQWQLRNGHGIKRAPVLGKLDGIVCRDALVNRDGSEAVWPQADALVGNPPFLGGKLLRERLTDSYVDRLFKAYDGRVPAESDLVIYWFARAWEQIKAKRLGRAGLVATNSVRGGASRRVLDRIAAKGTIFDAWSDEKWVLDGAAVRVSLVCFGAAGEAVSTLDGRKVARINPDLTSGEVDFTSARRLAANAGVAFMGDTKGGAFDIPGALAREWLRLPTNANGRPNSDVLRPWANGMDVTRRSTDKWIIDFGTTMSEEEAAWYEAPFQYLRAHVHAERQKNRRESYRRLWWRFVEPRPKLRARLAGCSRYIVTPTIARHRVFAWLPARVCPDHQLIVTARDDETTFGILHSRFHELWSLALCSWLGVGNDPRYTPSSTFETFPFPDGLTPDLSVGAITSTQHLKGIAQAAKALCEARERWLNPPELVQRVPEVVPGYPKRLLPASAAAATALRKLTLTNLYNLRPAWLDNLHRNLDAAVAAAYGWRADISNDDALAELLELNRARVAGGRRM